MSGHTLESWVGEVCAALVSEPEQVILVGHSRAGIVISSVAERMPAKVRELVYVAGFLLNDGESVLRMLRADGHSSFLRQVTLSPDRSRWILPPGVARALFYEDCSERDAETAISRLAIEPAAPMMTPIRVSDAAFGRVSRSYVECARDAAVPLDLQRKMQSRLPCRRVVTLECGHSPFFSHPEVLAGALAALAEPED